MLFPFSGARIVICGAISQYNSSQVTGPSNYLSLLVNRYIVVCLSLCHLLILIFMHQNRARMEGFVIFDYAKEFPGGRPVLLFLKSRLCTADNFYLTTAIKEIFEWVQAGKIKYNEDVVAGLTNAPKALNLLFTGMSPFGLYLS